jgi:hypothetical protein
VHQIANATEAGRIANVILQPELPRTPGRSEDKKLFYVGKFLSTVAKRLPTSEFKTGDLIPVTVMEDGFASGRNHFGHGSCQTAKKFPA